MTDIATRRQIESRSIIILAAVAISVAAAGFTVFYRTNHELRKAELAELAKSQARLMEAIGKHDAFFQSGEVQGAARAATLSQIRESHRKYTGFAETGEITLAERQGDQIVFLLPTRRQDFQIPKSLNFDSKLAEPMRLALTGGSGTIQGLDHSGEVVLAAYEYLPFLEMGLVVKMDKSELHQPFVHAGGVAAVVAALAILIAMFLNRKTVGSLVQKVYDFTDEIREREQRFSSLVSNIPGAVYRASLGPARTMEYLSDPIFDLTGYAAAEFIGAGSRSFSSIVHPDDAQILRKAFEQYLEPGRSYTLEYRVRHTDGSHRWVYDQGSVSSAEGGSPPILDGVMIDISDRKAAEHELEELPRKLSKYISPQVYESIFSGGKDVKIGSSRKKLTVFFSDIVGFTTVSEHMEAEDLSHMVNSYLNRMAQIAIHYGGTVDKFIGDGVMIFFGDPDSHGIRPDALACVHMAMAMQKESAALQGEWQDFGIHVPLQVRMGITTGYCTVGNFGSDSRMDYTILGRTVNLASRLESSAVPGTILISKETHALIRDEIECIEKEPVHVKGFDHPVQTYEVAGTAVDHDVTADR